LLDHLATKLLDDGWSLKALHRYIVHSATWRQASHNPSSAPEIDPENQLYWKMNRQRLDWEALRDALLTVSGQLDRTVGGKSVELTKSPFPRRRTLYGTIDRQDLPNLFRVFDLASPDTSVAQRATTTVPQQALFLMNAPFVLEQAAALAERSAQPAPASDAARIEKLFQIVFTRAPSAEEQQFAAAFLAAAGEGQEAVAWKQLCHALLMANELAWVD
jgi:hypothetical protein